MAHEVECTIVDWQNFIQTFLLQYEKNAGELDVKRAGEFRHWVQEMWYRHREECEVYRDSAKSPADYWAQYKWWLKREFRFQCKDAK